MINRQKIIRVTGLMIASLYLMFTQPATAAPADNLPRLTTDSEGHMVCHLCGPEKKDSYFLADYPQGYKIKTASYSKIQDTSRYAILMSDSSPGAAANQTPDFFYIDKLAATPAISSIQFDNDRSNLSSARSVSVTEKMASRCSALSGRTENVIPSRWIMKHRLIQPRFCVHRTTGSFAVTAAVKRKIR